MLDNSHWIPLLDYALKKGISLSTLRRHIKAHKIQFRLENGRYLILCHPSSIDAAPAEFEDNTRSDSNSDSLIDRVKRLETQMRQTQEEMTELKMLVAFYEEVWSHSNKET